MKLHCDKDWQEMRRNGIQQTNSWWHASDNQTWLLHGLIQTKTKSESSGFAIICSIAARDHTTVQILLIVMRQVLQGLRTGDWGLRPIILVRRCLGGSCPVPGICNGKTSNWFKIEIQNARYNKIQISTIRCECVCESGEGWGHFLWGVTCRRSGVSFLAPHKVFYYYLVLWILWLMW